MMTSNQNTWLDPSPSNAILSSQTDTPWLSIDDKSVKYINKVAKSVLYEDSTYSDTSSTVLEELDEWIKEEPFSDWLEEKIDVPIFEDISFNQQEQQFQQYENLKNLNNRDTQYLLEEFDTILGEACQQQQLLLFSSTSSTLTPPQSPPLLQTNLEPTIVPYIAEENQLIPSSSQWNPETVSLIPLGDEGANLVNELLNPYKTKTNEEEDQEEEEKDGELNSNHDDEVQEDPDWIIENDEQVRKPSRKRRYQPYSRATGSFTQDKKVRKKEQNKNAATKYRQKKKEEFKVIIGEEQELQERNETLKSRVIDLEREIGYLKGLMKDMFKAKGLVK